MTFETSRRTAPQDQKFPPSVLHFLTRAGGLLRRLDRRGVAWVATDAISDLLLVGRNPADGCLVQLRSAPGSCRLQLHDGVDYAAPHLCARLVTDHLHIDHALRCSSFRVLAVQCQSARKRGSCALSVQVFTGSCCA